MNLGDWEVGGRAGTDLMAVLMSAYGWLLKEGRGIPQNNVGTARQLI